MRNKFLSRFVSLLFSVVLCQVSIAQNITKDFSFIVSSDQRAHATEAFRSHEYTMGGYEAIKKVGKGSFMIVLGDLDPPQATFDLIDNILGKDYKRYAVVGNHDIENPESIEYLRAMNRGNISLPNIVRKGPAGSEETTYSFDYGDVHFVVLNVYYDGKADNAADGNIAPELLSWFENDLKLNKKKHVFVFGHEPLFPVLDMETGTVRHEGDALDKYPLNTLKFEQVLQKYKVTAYLSGHVHCASYSSINGIWLLNSGHIYGQEDNYTAEKLYARLITEIEKAKSTGVSQQDAIKVFFQSQLKEIKKVVFNFGFGDGKGTDYKSLTDEETWKHFNEFFDNCLRDKSELQRYSQLFWKNTIWRPSTFLKIKIHGNSAILEIYRDKDFFGNYELKHTQVLYK
ncbi:MAG: metallophosphoesterase [Ignavibacteriales bacterium]|nr:metallophosphoesterase [Ignavibacteriales bacterium]